MNQPPVGPKERSALHGGSSVFPEWSETNARPVQDGGKEGRLPAQDDAARCALDGKSGSLLP